jgi:hypothetical protein
MHMLDEGRFASQYRGALNPLGWLNGWAFILVTLLAIVAAPTGNAQNFSGEVTIYLDPWEFNLGAFSPPAPQSGVFSGGPANLVPITIRQFDNGSMTISAQSRAQAINTTSTETSTIGLSIGASQGFTANGTATVGQSNAVNTSIESGLSFKLDGNVLIAVVQYPYSGVTYVNELSLGIITPGGGFQQFNNGILAGKSVVSEANGVDATTNINPDNAPGVTVGSGTRYHGFRDNTQTPVYAQIVVGYWVMVGRVNGQIVSVSVEPQYSTVCVGFRSTPRVYSAPNQSGGGELLK